MTGAQSNRTTDDGSPRNPQQANLARTEPKKLTVIFKGSDRCNGRCRFCSVGHPRGQTISDADFDHLVSELETVVSAWALDRLEFTFHGGEPTLLGARFLDRACRQLRDLDVEVGFSMQSNLLHLDPAVWEVLNRYDVRVGTSIDPISAERLDGKGKDAFPIWLKNYLYLAKTQEKPPGAIFVVTKRAIGMVDHLIEVCESISRASGKPFGLQINPVYAQGMASEMSDILITAREYGSFLLELWRRWENSAKQIKLTPIQQLADYYVHGKRPISQSCAYGLDCSRSHVGVDFNLNVAGCGRRLDSKAFFGNLKKEALRTLLETNAESKKIAQRADTLRAGHCRDCPYFTTCAGGCPDDAALAYGDVSAPFEWCESYKALFAAMETEGRRRADRPAQTNSDISAGLLRPAQEIHIARLPKTLAQQSISPDRRTGRWVFASADGHGIRFGDGLQSMTTAPHQRVRIWIHNAQAPNMAMWEKLLHSPYCGVSLYESTGLKEAIEKLAQLGASIYLDIAALAETDSFEHLFSLLEKYVFESDFQAQIFPFSRMLLNAVNGGGPQWMNRWGLEPENFRIHVSEDEVIDADFGGRDLLAELRREADLSLPEWLAARPDCSDCKFRTFCGGILSCGDGTPCAPKIQRLAAAVERVALRLKEAVQTLAR
jgi:radical SAM protein with 4Fe4S-binding SPASM domain